MEYRFKIWATTNYADREWDLLVEYSVYGYGEVNVINVWLIDKYDQYHDIGFDVFTKDLKSEIEDKCFAHYCSVPPEPEIPATPEEPFYL